MLAAVAVACGSPEAAVRAEPEARAVPASRPERPAPATTPAAAPKADPEADAPLVVFLGDSLTAGYGLAEEQAYPALVGERLAALGHAVRVVNAGVSGDTTAGGLARLDWVLRQEPDVLVVGLGANDGLRGLPLDATEQNLRTIVERARESGASVLLLGMQIPPNYGPDYAVPFSRMYGEIARDLDVPLVPFLLEGVGGVPDLNLPDGIHPNIEGQRRVAENVVSYLEDLIAGEDARAG